MADVPNLPIGVKEFAGQASPGYGLGLHAAQFMTPGSSLEDIPLAARKKMLESGSNVSALGTIAGGALGAGLGGFFGDDSVLGHIGAGLGGALTGAAVGGAALPAAYAWHQGRKVLKTTAAENADETRKEREAIETRAKHAEADELWATEYVKLGGFNGAMYGGAVGGALGGVTGAALDPNHPRGFVAGTMLGMPVGSLIGYNAECMNDEAEAQKQSGLIASGIEGAAIHEGLATPFVKRTDENMNTHDARHPNYHMKGRTLGYNLGLVGGGALGALAGHEFGAGAADAIGEGDMSQGIQAIDTGVGAAGGAALGAGVGHVAGGALGGLIPGRPQPLKRAFTDDFSFLPKMAALASSVIDNKGVRTRTGYYRWLANKRLQAANG